MTWNPTPLVLPSMDGHIRDVYVEADNHVFLVLTDWPTLYQLGRDPTTHQWTVLHGVNLTSSNDYYRIYGDFARSEGWVFINRGSGIQRFSKTDLRNTSFVSYPSEGLMIAFDTQRHLAFGVQQEDNFVYIFNVETMSLVSTFDYALGGPWPSWQSDTPGGWAIAADSSRSLLYIGVDCDSPTPANIWQFDYSNLNTPRLTNWVTFGADQCFEEGFVNPTDGRAWFYEDDAGWAGGFGVQDLNFGRDWTVPTGLYVESLEFDAATNTGFFITNGNGDYNTPGQVFRTCLLETGISATHEWINWGTTSDDIGGSHWDAANHTLYTIGYYSHVVTTITVGATTDCSQSPSSVASVGTSLAGVGRSIMKNSDSTVPMPYCKKRGDGSFCLDDGVSDVYVENDNELFVVLTTLQLYVLNYTDTEQWVQGSGEITNFNGIIYGDLGRSEGWLFLADNDNLYRFNKNDMSRYNVSEAPTSDFYFAIDSARKLGFTLGWEDNYVYIWDLTQMEVLANFSYYQGSFSNNKSNGEANGWAMAVDSARSVLYVSSYEPSPVPNVIWQYSYSDIYNVQLLNHVVIGPYWAFEEGFVSLYDGRAWFFEDYGGWAGGFGLADLNWGKQWVVPIGTYVERLEYDQATNTGFFIASGTSDQSGQVFRTCLLETGPGATHEWADWTSDGSSTDVYGSYWDAHASILYVIDSDANVWAVTVGPTDCSQSSSASQLTSPLFWLYAQLKQLLI